MWGDIILSICTAIGEAVFSNILGVRKNEKFKEELR